MRIEKTTPVGDIITAINTGTAIFEAALPFINEIIKKIQDAGTSDSLATPHGKRVHIERLEALAKLEEQKHALYDGYFTQLLEKGIVQ